MMNYRNVAIGLGFRVLAALLLAGLVSPAVNAQGMKGGAGEVGGQVYSLHRVDSAGSLAGGTEPLSSCGDALSIALQQGTPEFPCWANIRTVDRWNSASIGYGLSPTGSGPGTSPYSVPSGFTFTAGGLNAFSLPGNGEGKAYGGLAALSGLVERRRWQMMAEDAGGAADFQLAGAHFVGLNLAAVRLTGEITPRLTWQGSAANTYGTDAVRQVAPLDYRMVGKTDAPSLDAPAYGLYGGLMTSGEEGVKMRYETSRGSAWDVAATDNYTKYNSYAFLVHTARAHVELLHNIADGVALGFYGFGENQTQPLSCTLGGGGMRMLSYWGDHASLNVSGGVGGANPSCGKRAQFVGDAALYTQLNEHTDFYVNANRDLGNGVLQETTFLSSGGVGIRHRFNPKADVHASLNEIYGTDHLTNQTFHGSFVDGSLHTRLWGGFSDELEIRNFSFAGMPAPTGRTVGVVTLWWSPSRQSEGGQNRASLR